MPGIFYQGFTVGTINVVGAQRYNVPSSPNIINSGFETRAMYGGSPALKINTTASGSPTDTFNLLTIRFALALNTATGLGSPTAGTVLFVGNKPNGQASVAYQAQFQYTTGQTEKVTFATAIFPAFVGLKEVFITVTSAILGVVDSTINPLIDDVCLSIYG